MSDTTHDPDEAPNPVRAQRTLARQREERAFELRCKHWSLTAIGVEIGVSKQAVSMMLRRIESRTLRQLTARVGLLKARQTVQIDHLIAESYEAWQKSKKPGRKNRLKTTKDGMETTREKTYRDGDPRWIGEIRSLLSAQRDIWRIGRGENETENDDGAWNYDAMLAEKREAMWATLSPADRARRLAFQADKLRAELAGIEADIATATATDPTEGDQS
jgi:hypothetical protein